MNLFLAVLEAKKYRLRQQLTQFLLRASLHTLQMAAFLLSLYIIERKIFPSSSPYKAKVLLD